MLSYWSGPIDHFADSVATGPNKYIIIPVFDTMFAKSTILSIQVSAVFTYISITNFTQLSHAKRAFSTHLEWLYNAYYIQMRLYSLVDFDSCWLLKNNMSSYYVRRLFNLKKKKMDRTNSHLTRIVKYLLGRQSSLRLQQSAY